MVAETKKTALLANHGAAGKGVGYASLGFREGQDAENWGWRQGEEDSPPLTRLTTKRIIADRLTYTTLHVIAIGQAALAHFGWQCQEKQKSTFHPAFRTTRHVMVDGIIIGR